MYKRTHRLMTGGLHFAISGCVTSLKIGGGFVKVGGDGRLLLFPPLRNDADVTRMSLISEAPL